MELRIGDKAPDFSLRNNDGEIVQLSTLTGENVLLLFFPFAFTGVCTKELCQVRDDIELYNSVDAKILGISVDSQFTLAQYAKLHNLNFPLLSDFNKSTSKAYGCLYDDFIGYYEGVSKRAAFLIDKDGVIQYAEVLESAGDMPNFELIQAALKDLNHIMTHNIDDSLSDSESRI